MTTTLLLSVNYEPLRVIPIKRALLLVLQEKAEVLEESDDVWRSARVAVPVPKVIRLKYFVRIPYQARIPLNRKAVLLRDGERCAYAGQPRRATDPQCTGHATTVDHVIPRSKLRSRAHRWENVVAACPHCNFLKADRSLEELEWRLGFTPYAPTGTRWLVIGIAQPDPAWGPYLGIEGAQAVA